MRENNFRMNLKSRLIDSCKEYIYIVAFFAPVIVILRVYESISVGLSTNLLPGFVRLEFIGLFVDADFWLRIFLYFFIPYCLISYFSSRVAKYTINSILILLIILQISLVQFLVYMSEPLNSAIYRFSFTDILFIISASGGFNVANTLSILIIPLLPIILQKYLVKLIKKPRFLIIVFLTFFVLLACVSSVFIRLTYFKNRSHNEYYIVLNKQDYFFNATFEYFNNKEKVKDEFEDILKEINSFHQEYQAFNYCSNEYPLLRQKDTANVLGPNFNRFDSKPNVVIIIVESLSSAYSGPNAGILSFTPFIDSLVPHSMYWSNCLSTSERSFGVLSSVLGSLPYGEVGFASMYEAMPVHESIISILNKNGYKSSFTYGAQLKYDGVGAFMKRQQTSKIITDYGSPSQILGWAYPDEIIIKKYEENTSRYKDFSIPRIDVINTLSMHEPFAIPNSKQYESKAQEIIQNSRLPQNIKNDLDNYWKPFSTFIYTDEQIRLLFDWYKKRKDFANTIFIITGDHRVETYCSSGMDRFRVPLIIYSPKLKRHLNSRAVVNHLQITPSILSLLEKSSNLIVPDKVHWLGGMLDTFKYYRNTTEFALMRFDRNIDFMYGAYYLSGNSLYLTDSLFGMREVTNDSVKNLLRSKKEVFKAINNYTCSYDKLLPSLLNKKKDNILFESAKIDKSITSSNEYFNICPDIKIPDAINSVSFDIEFDLNAETASVNENPIIAIAFVNEKNESVFWEGAKFKGIAGRALKAGVWEKVTVHKVVNFEMNKIKAGNIFSVTLWNYKKIENFKIKNLRIKVKSL